MSFQCRNAFALVVFALVIAASYNSVLCNSSLAVFQSSLEHSPLTLVSPLKQLLVVKGKRLAADI